MYYNKAIVNCIEPKQLLGITEFVRNPNNSIKEQIIGAAELGILNKISYAWELGILNKISYAWELGILNKISYAWELGILNKISYAWERLCYEQTLRCQLKRNRQFGMLVLILIFDIVW